VAQETANPHASEKTREGKKEGGKKKRKTVTPTHRQITPLPISISPLHPKALPWVPVRLSDPEDEKDGEEKKKKKKKGGS